MKKIYTITFHASHNYGSCLQAYALQEYIKKICNNECEYRIINLRTKKQKEMYKSCYEKKGFNNYIKRIVSLGQKKNILLKEKLFEKFINNKLNITKEFESIKDIINAGIEADYYITGSDQVWNIKGTDFDWSYFLEFISQGKKISYAASMGPSLDKWSDEEKNRVKNDLKSFKNISVRDKNGYEFLKKLTGKTPNINIDPTMLLEKDDWDKIIPKKPIINGDYIFFYNLKDKRYIELAHKISKKLNLPVVISLYNLKDIVYGSKYGFKKKIDVGPIEFLNLIENSKLMLSSSFHGTIFPIILNKTFFALNGENDFRISTILNKMGLENRSINFDDFEKKCKTAFSTDYTKAKKLLKVEREKANSYLKDALEIK